MTPNADYEGRSPEDREAGLAAARDAIARGSKGIIGYLTTDVTDASDGLNRQTGGDRNGS